jgi:molecular chaperone HtpG
MQEMSRMFGGMDMGMFPTEETLVLNRKNSLIQLLLKLKDREDRKEDAQLICEQVYDLAMMSHKQLEPDAMSKFVERSNQILLRLAENAG